MCVFLLFFLSYPGPIIQSTLDVFRYVDWSNSNLLFEIQYRYVASFHCIAVELFKKLLGDKLPKGAVLSSVIISRSFNSSCEPLAALWVYNFTPLWHNMASFGDKLGNMFGPLGDQIFSVFLAL